MIPGLLFPGQLRYSEPEVFKLVKIFAKPLKQALKKGIKKGKGRRGGRRGRRGGRRGQRGGRIIDPIKMLRPPPFFGGRKKGL